MMSLADTVSSSRCLKIASYIGLAMRMAEPSGEVDARHHTRAAGAWRGHLHRAPNSIPP